MELMVPPLPALGEIATATRDRHIDNDETFHCLRMSCCDCMGRRPAPIMPHNKMEGIVPQFFVNHAPDIMANGLFVVAGQRARTIAETTHIRRDDTIFLGQGRNLMSPFPPGLRIAVDQDHRRPFARRHVMEQYLAEIGIVVRDHRVIRRR